MHKKKQKKQPKILWNVGGNSGIMAVKNFESASYFKLIFDITSGAPGELRTNVDISFVYHKQTLNIMDTLDPDCALTHAYHGA
jgi:hypothetical protein